MECGLFIDFGSTYTKLVAVDLEQEEVLGTAKAPTTIATNIMHGLEEGMRDLAQRLPSLRSSIRLKYACSSAAGGLRMIAIGLVPELTSEAAKRAALGAGAKVIATFSYELTEHEIHQIEEMAPDIILLAGGTDGGNKNVIIHNGELLAKSNVTCPIIYAGNKSALDRVKKSLTECGKDVRISDNVLPDLDNINVEPVRSTIREVFIERIVQSKGLSDAEKFVDGPIIPTPAAILEAAKCLALHNGKGIGLGDIIVIDPGGATTDVHSVAKGLPTRPATIMKGLKEPYVKRTVEGDLGVRINALSILEEVGPEQLLQNIGEPCAIDVDRLVKNLSAAPSTIPSTPEDYLLDIGLAASAVQVAMDRHAGTIERFYTPMGETMYQRGKDLTEVNYVIGTGGPIVHSSDPARVLKMVLHDPGKPDLLKPKAPTFLLDQRYIMFAMGLLSQYQPEKAFRILCKYLQTVGEPGRSRSCLELLETRIKQ